MAISVKQARYLTDYKMEIFFSDGTRQTIDFKKFLLNAKNPMVKRYLDLKLFRKFNIDYGDLEWNDYELCFPVWDLHEGKIN